MSKKKTATRATAKKRAAKKRPAKKAPVKKAKRKTAKRASRRRTTTGGAKSLDPKLRRLVNSLKDGPRLHADAGRGFIASAAADLTGPPPAETCFKRVLVRLNAAQVPESLADLTWTPIVEAVYSVNVPLSRLESLGACTEVEYVDAGQEFTPTLDSSVPETRADQVRNPPAGAGPAFDGSGVVVGIIDYGFDFTLDDFRNPDGSTRVAFLWDQFLTPQGSEHHPSGFTFGVEYDESDINSALAAANPFSQVRHEPNPGSHGTHVAGAAAGNGRSADATFAANRYVGTAPNARIIFVQPATNDQTSTFTDSAHVAEAIAYIYGKAAELGMPCVINMSLGQNGGSHDGESTVERAMDRLLETPGRAFVVAAGNEHIWRTHASGTLTPQGKRVLHWRVGASIPVFAFPPGFPPGLGDFSPNEMEVWYSSRDQFRVKVADPDGNETDTFDPGESDSITLPSGDRVFIDSERFTVVNGDSRIYIEVSPAPFHTLTEGIWTVELEAIEVREGRFDAWIERDARRALNRFEDQSFFLGTDFDPVLTLGTPATSRRTVVVANYNHVTQAPSDSSGRGTTRDGRCKPEVAAPGTDIVSSHALGGRPNPAGGTFPVRLPMSGTSMSAPHVAGIIGLMFQADGRLTAEQIRKILIASAQPPLGVSDFDPAWGYGRVDARAAVDLIE